MGIKVRCWTCYTCTYWSIDETDWSSEQPSIDFQTTMKHGLTKITAQIICGFRMMGLMHQKYLRAKANVWLFSSRYAKWGFDWRLRFSVSGQIKDDDYHQEMNSFVFLVPLLCKTVLENNFFLTKIWAHRIFCFNIVITCII
jgi:hypothetical protein